MTESVHAVIKLQLLLCLIRTGICGERLTFGERSYEMNFPCKKSFFCYDVWHFKAIEIATVFNGMIQKRQSQDDESCTLQITNLTGEGHRCPTNPAATELLSPPGEASSLQCVLLTFIKQEYCDPRVSLMWVDEAGAPIQEDSKHQVEQRSLCDITLTVAPLSLANETFECQVTVDGKVQTSRRFWVKTPDLKGRGRTFVSEAEPEHKGLSGDTAGMAGGVVGCAVVTALVAAFVVNKIRGKNQESAPDKSSNANSANHDPDDVIYTEVILPVSSDRGTVQECEPTVYACVRC